MKKLLILFLIISLALTGCGASEEAEKEDNIIVAEDYEEAEEETEKPEEKEDEKEETEKEVEGLKSIEEYKEIILSNMHESETLEDVKLEGNNIIIKLDMGFGDTFPGEPKKFAINRYSVITDGLLEAGGDLEDITIEFKGIGSITINTSESISNEYAEFFDGKLVEERFEE